MDEPKSSLRDQARRHRASLHVKADDYDSAARHFFDTIKPRPGQIISAYWPKGREFDPQIILEIAREQGIECALPLVQSDSKILKFARWTPATEMIESALGILQPKIEAPDDELCDPDIVLLPLLAYDRRGYRLGQGGGYYDATLADLRAKKPVTAVGLAFAEQAVLFNLPVEAHDQKMDWVVTPAGAQSFI